MWQRSCVWYVCVSEIVEFRSSTQLPLEDSVFISNEYEEN